jgi:hypothetical protein
MSEITLNGRAIQVAPDAVPKGTRPKTALQIALATGQHSLVSLLLKSGYRLDLERYAPLDMALQGRAPAESKAHPGRLQPPDVPWPSPEAKGPISTSLL